MSSGFWFNGDMDRTAPSLHLRLRMPCEMHFGAFREEPFAPALTPAREGGAAAFGAHAGAETVLLFPRPFRSL